jgi:hypothetical protein
MKTVIELARADERAAPVQEPLMEPEGKCKECLTYNGHQDGCSHAAPPAPVPLTDEQIEHLWETRVSQPCPRYPLGKADWVQFARAIEAAHGITKDKP